MTTWNDEMIEKLKNEIKTHKGQGTSRVFKNLRSHIISRIGTVAWERMLGRAKRKYIEETK